VELHTFGKQQRLLNAKAYKTVFDDAQLKVSTKEILILALVIAKKNVRLAVQRNRIKRVIRESFRLQGSANVTLDSIVLARKGLDKMNNAAVHSMIDRLWHQLHKRAKRQLTGTDR